MQFSAIESPVVIGSASLVAFISVRSTSIADRIRTIDREIVDPATSGPRRTNLLFQVRGLRRRYAADTYAMLAMLSAFVAFVAMGALDAFSRGSAIAAFGLGVAAGVVGFALTLYEVFTAKITLFADIEYAEAVARNDAPTNHTSKL